MKIIYVVIVIFVMLYRFYRNAVKQQQAAPNSKKQPKAEPDFDAQQWMQEFVLSNTSSPRSEQVNEYPVETFRRPTYETTINELEADREVEIETELNQYKTISKGRKKHTQVSAQKDIPIAEPQHPPMASVYTSLPAVGTIDWQNAVIISELLGPPKGLQ